MTWFKIDDGFSTNRKVDDLGEDQAVAIACWTLCGSACMRDLTGGIVTRAALRRVLAAWSERERLRATRALVRVSLWHEHPDGWVFHDWSHYQPSRESVLSERDRKARNQREARERRRSSTSPVTAPVTGDMTGESPGDISVSHRSPDPTRPDQLSSLRSDSARVSDKVLRGFGLPASRTSGKEGITAVITEYANRFRIETGQPWLSPDAIKRIVNGNAQRAHWDIAEHIDAIAGWLESIPESEQSDSLKAMLDGAWLDDWMRKHRCPLKRLAADPGRWVSAAPKALKRNNGDSPGWHPCDGEPKSKANLAVYQAWLDAGSPWDRTWKPSTRSIRGES